MKAVMRWVCVVIGILAMPVVTWAQGAGAASIVGTVRDTSGAVLPGVTVEAASPALIEKARVAVTDGRGEYRLLELRPGVYSVSFTLPGFAVFKRDELELSSGFSATVNVELRVGTLEETVTVSGESPLVDIRNVTAEKSISKQLLDAVPTGKSIYGFVAMMPAAMTPANQQDVGGSLGESTVRISIHGAKTEDARLLMDGMSYNILNANGTARNFFVNPLSAQEFVLDTGSGGSAEWDVGGAIVNLISRDGGSRFSGSLFASGSTEALQSNNLSQALRDQGLTSVDRNIRIYDLNVFLGGPVKQDRLWFASSHRRQGQRARIANLYQDANWAARVYGAPAEVWRFTPDFSRPVEPAEDNQAHNIRLTWQASSKDKIDVSWDREWNRQQNNTRGLNTGTLAWEANSVGGAFRCGVENFVKATWNRAASERLLFEGAWTLNDHHGGSDPCKSYINADRVEIRDVGINFTYNGYGTVSRTDDQRRTDQRFSMTLVRGAHTFKTGLSAIESLPPHNTFGSLDRSAVPFTYTFRNGTPIAITQFVAPYNTLAAVRMSLGLFVQDQWRLQRLTLNYGLRYQYHNAYAPAFRRPAGPLQDAAEFPEVDCLPCWHDIYPRLSAVYDLFGDGKTALKASIGRFGAGQLTGYVELYAPYVATVANTPRSWNDRTFPVGDPRRENFFPDCDLRSLSTNGECGPAAIQGFGQTQVRARMADGFNTGWNKRGYNWQTSVGIDRELRPGVALSGGFFRTWWGNQTVLDNLEVGPADFDPYCITAPTDSRLPANISGQRICGFYDVKPEKFGRVNIVEDLAEKYGNYTEVYNGADASLSVRLPNGAQFSGGWNVGNSVSLTGGWGGSLSKINRCFVVDSPMELYNCETANPYLHRFKMNGSYPLPWELQAAFVFQTQPGPPYSVAASAGAIGGAGGGGGAWLSVPTAAIAPSLGRNLSGNTQAVTVDLLPAYSAFGDWRINQLDLRLSKIFRLGGTRLQANVDLYNALNSSVVTQVRHQYTATTWLQPTQIMPGRLAKFGVQLDF